MPRLDEVAVKVGDETPIALFIGGEEEPTGDGGTPDPPDPPTPPEFAIAPEHAWWAAGYAGTGPLEDTGSTGGIDLNPASGTTYEDGMFLGGDEATTADGENYSSPFALRTTTGTPQFGTAPFTVLWVGAFRGQVEDINDQFQYFFTGQNLWAEDGTSEVNLSTTCCWGDADPPNISGVAGFFSLDAWNGGSHQGISTLQVPIPHDLGYIALTRTGTTMGLLLSYDGGELTLDISGDMSNANLTGAGMGFGGRNTTAGGAVWLGQVLTPEQIEQAAEELGYEPPPITASANHLWNAAQYAGTGDFLDTGTTGGIDLITTGSPYVNERFVSSGYGDHYPYNYSQGPAFGTADFTIMWVGVVVPEVSPTPYFFAFDQDLGEGPYCFGVTPTQIKVGSYAGDPNQFGSDDWSQTVPEYDGPYYVAITRVGDLFTLYMPGNAPYSEALTDAETTLTAHSVYAGISAETSGLSIWLGQALTEEQLAQAATELGYVA